MGPERVWDKTGMCGLGVSRCAGEPGSAGRALRGFASGVAPRSGRNPVSRAFCRVQSGLEAFQ